MKDGPDIARIAALVGDPARANMLTALVGGLALTAGELAREAAVTPATASSHLAKLEDGGLIAQQKQGRHRYFRLSGPDVADVLERLMGLAARTGHARTRPGPREPAMRRARVCYDHLAGDLGVQAFDSLVRRGLIDTQGAAGDETVTLTPDGARFFAGEGLDLAALGASRRPLCKPCLDWSNRRNHLAGALGAAILDQLTAKGWARRLPGSRVVSFSPAGEAAFGRMFPAE